MASMLKMQGSGSLCRLTCSDPVAIMDWEWSGYGICGAGRLSNNYISLMVSVSYICITLKDSPE